MKRLNSALPSRAMSNAGRVARSKKDAAIQLVRIEFDISRLETAISQAERRATAHARELATKSRQKEALMQILSDKASGA